ncbi:hypothetical protein TNCV_325481 [Trichonephila clavipes]|nr:hypothetical protein TNCV_325481 [Trichonephila clavipes]
MMIPAYNKKGCAAFETGIHYRLKTCFFPEEDIQPCLTRDSNRNSLGYKPRVKATILPGRRVQCVRFHILHGLHSVSGYPNNRVSERCPVPIDSDK